MPISFDSDEAAAVIGDAVARANGSAQLPVEWSSHAVSVFALESKTYTPALVTMLLAKALNDGVDVLAIKIGTARSFSLRGLGHGVVVPAASSYGFSLRTTGREPLNNQPWFRYNRVDEFERVRNRAEYETFLAIARRANELSSNEAFDALAALLRVAFRDSARLRAVSVRADGLSAQGLVLAAEDFLRSDAPDRPRRLQALGAASFDLVHSDVRSRKINDPSRVLPGDVLTFVGTVPITSMEVRGKKVSASDLSVFVDACADAGVGRAVLFVDAPDHVQLDLDEMTSHALRTEAIAVEVFESTAELIRAAILWSPQPLSAAVSLLAERFLERLKEIEVSESAQNEWARAVAVLRNR